MIAYIFPGQGSQCAGMGRALHERSAIARDVFGVVDEALGFSLTDIMFGDDASALTPTEIQQPAIFAHSVATFAALRKRHERGPAMVAGHSLGEYSALLAAGCIDLATAARLVRTRGEMMAEAGEQVGGAMAAAIGMERDQVTELVQDASAEGELVVANYNCPGQIVISGTAEAVAAARKIGRERGARIVPLKVSGAFHSPLMAPVVEQLRPHIAGAGIVDATVPLVSNVDATPRTDAEGLSGALVAQITGSVLWEDSVRRMIAEGADTFVELGPGTVLSKMIPRIDDGVTTYSVDDFDSLQAVLGVLG